jgi:hypothetical protein
MVRCLDMYGVGSVLRARWVGTQLDAVFMAITPEILDESAIAKFRFHQTGRLWEGIRYNGELYGLVETFDSIYRLQAYCLAWMLTEDQIPNILTTSDTRFAVWVNIRSPQYPGLLKNP